MRECRTNIEPVATARAGGAIPSSSAAPTGPGGAPDSSRAPGSPGARGGDPIPPAEAVKGSSTSPSPGSLDHLADHAPRPSASPPRSFPDERQCGQILDSMGSAVLLAADDGRTLWANLRASAMDESVRDRIAGACREAARGFAQRSGSLSIGDPSRRYEVGAADDSRWYEVVVSPVLDEKSAWQGRVAAVARDITRARRVEQKMAAIDLAGRELVRLDRDAVRRLNAGERLQLLRDKIIRYAHDLLNFDHFAIRVLDERTGKLELIISCGLSPGAADTDVYPAPDRNGIAGYVAFTGRSYICHDSEKDERFRPLLLGSRSSVVVPLRLHDKVQGVLDAESLQVGAFTEDDRQFAEIFSRYIALALQMLDLLVAERSSTNEAISGRVEGEIREPLEDIVREVEALRAAAERDPELARHVGRIRADADAIRRRMKNVAAGSQSLLGIDRALAAPPDPLLRGRRVLVADDEAKVREDIDIVLGRKGCDVVCCDSGVAAIDRLAAAALSGESFDLVLSDIKMPDRNGYEVFAAARRTFPGVPVILMTGFGYDPHHSIVRASEEGLQNVLYKPFAAERLLEEVRKAVDSTAARG